MPFDDLLDVAETLIAAGRGKPKQVFLRRAVSTVYYALFHVLAGCCADSLIGATAIDRKTATWQQVYRSLDHGFAKSQCRDARVRQFSQPVQDFADFFSAMQTKRHQADYDPFERFAKSSVMLDLVQARAVIRDFLAVSLRERRAFAAFVLLKTRKI